MSPATQVRSGDAGKEKERKNRQIRALIAVSVGIALMIASLFFDKTSERSRTMLGMGCALIGVTVVLVMGRDRSAPKRKT